MSFRRALIASLSMGTNSCKAFRSSRLLDKFACPPPLSSRKQVQHRILGAVTRRDRPIDEHRPADYVAPRHCTPVPAVFTVIAIVAHAKVLIGIITAIVIGVLNVAIFRVFDFVRYWIALFGHPKWLADAKEGIGACIVIALVENGVPRAGGGALVGILFERARVVRRLIHRPDPVLGQLLAIYVYAMSFRIVFDDVARQTYYALDIIGFGPVRVFENDYIAPFYIAIGEDRKVDA